MASKTESKTDKADEQPTAPEGNAPAPEQPEHPEVNLPKPPEALEPVDRATYVGPVNARTPETDVPKDYLDPEADLGAKPVEVFQVISNNGALALRIDGNATVFDVNQARALSRDVAGALAGVTT